MLGRSYEGQDCAAARTLELVGERWSLLILRDALFRGFTRFSDFQHSLGVAPNILACRLEAFVAAGLMRTVKDARHPQHRRYLLTERGQDFKSVIIALAAWGDTWLGPGPVDFVHAGCAGVVRQHVRCERCGAEPAASALAAAVRPRSSPGKARPQRRPRTGAG
jgi:DNA-binding HxlR family transcriptional regulator